VGKTRLAR